MTKTVAIRWSCQAPGSHQGSVTIRPGYTVIYVVSRVTLDDGEWWIVVYPGGAHSDPTQYLATAKQWAQDDAEEKAAS